MRRLGRLAGITAVTVLFCLLPAGPAHAATPVAAKSADAFVDSFGVNMQLTHGGVWDPSNWPAMRQRLQDANIRNIRDGYGNTHQDISAFIQDMNKSFGLKVDFYAEDRSSTTIPNYEQMFAGELNGALASVEGPNEVDNRGPGWDTHYRDWQRQLAEAVRGNPVTAHVPLIAPSFGCSVCIDKAQALGDISAWTDYGNMHDYPGGEMLADWKLDKCFQVNAIMTPNQPVVSTETGFFQNLQIADPPQGPIAEAQAGTLGLRIFFDHYRRGVPKTYWFALVDGLASGDWGLVRNDAKVLSPKPIYNYIRDTTSLLKDPGTSFKPGSLAFTLQGANADTHTLLLQKRDGTFWLAVWQQAEVWARANLSVLSPPDVPMTLQLDAPATSMSVYHPGQGTQAVGGATNTATLRLSSGPNMQLVEIRSKSSSSAPAQVQPTSRPTTQPTSQPTSAPTSTPQTKSTPSVPTQKTPLPVKRHQPDFRESILNWLRELFQRITGWVGERRF